MPRAAFPSSRKSLLLILALVVAIIGGAWWWQRPPPDPVYEGQRLSEAFITAHDFGNEGAMRTFFDHFGPAGVTWLAYKLEYGRRVARPAIRPLPFDHAPEWLRRWLPARWGGHPYGGIDERLNAAIDLSKLGPEAAPAIPALARCLEDHHEDDEEAFGTAVAGALQAIGPKSWPTVEHILELGSPASKSLVLLNFDARLYSRGKAASETEAAKVVATILKACHDPDASVRAAAIWTIWRCRIARPDPELFDSTLPEVIRLLSAPEAEVRKAAATALIGSDHKAAAALPRLIEMLSDQDDDLRSAAAVALGHVDTVEKLSAVHLRAMVHNDPNPICQAYAATALQKLGLSKDDESASPEALPGR